MKQVAGQGGRKWPADTRRRFIVKKALTKPEQFERSAANLRPARLLISRVFGPNGRDHIAGSAWIASPVQHHGSAERDRGGCPSVASAPAPALQDAESPVSSCCTISATWARRHPTVAPTIVDGISFVLAAYFPCRCHWLT